VEWSSSAILLRVLWFCAGGRKGVEISKATFVEEEEEEEEEQEKTTHGSSTFRTAAGAGRSFWFDFARGGTYSSLHTSGRRDPANVVVAFVVAGETMLTHARTLHLASRQRSRSGVNTK
jgi:hypothetical protein